MTRMVPVIIRFFGDRSPGDRQAGTIGILWIPRISGWWYTYHLKNIYNYTVIIHLQRRSVLMPTVKPGLKRTLLTSSNPSQNPRAGEEMKTCQVWGLVSTGWCLVICPLIYIFCDLNRGRVRFAQPCGSVT